MSNHPLFTGWPRKDAKGFSVTVWFKSMADALNWMMASGVVSKETAQDYIENDERIKIAAIKKETRWLRSQIKKWLKI